MLWLGDAARTPYNRASRPLGRIATLTLLLVLALVNLLAILAVFLRRFLKNRYFVLCDERRLYWSEQAEKLLRGEPVPLLAPAARYPWDWQTAEEVLLERMGKAPPAQREQVEEVFRRWGLFQIRLRFLLWGNRWQQAHAALVLAQMGGVEALPAITVLLESGSRDVRLATGKALGLLGQPEAHRPLAKLCRLEPAASRILVAALVRCARFAPERLLPHLAAAEPAAVRRIAARALAELGGRAQTAGLQKASEDPDPNVRAQSVRALGRTGDPGALPAAERLARDPVWFVRLQAVGALGSLPAEQAEARLWQGIEDPHWRVRLKAVTALHARMRDPASLLTQLRARGGPPDNPALAVDLLEHEGVTWRAVQRAHSLLPYPREESQALLRELLRAGAYSAVFYALEMHPDRAVRGALLGLVKEVGAPGTKQRLESLLASPLLDADFRQEVRAALENHGWAQ